MIENRFGGFWRRAAAYGIDKIILHVISIILLLSGMLAIGLGFPAYHHGHGRGFFDGIPDGRFIVFYYAMTVFVNMIYFTWFHGATGQTPGKILLNLRVVQTMGDPMTFGVAFLRWVGCIISAAGICMGFIWVIFDRKKQGWHDKIAGTVVIREDRRNGKVQYSSG
jgi:uncharacterized RDD family membrane protein YckC